MDMKIQIPNKNDIKVASLNKNSSTNSNINNDSNNNHYASASTASFPITKNAQFAGNGANVIWTQPMFFSPLHTPQNWQIASKRREVMQWSFIEPCLLTYGKDFSVFSISELYNKISYNDVMPVPSELQEEYKLLNAQGKISKPEIISRHYANKEANKITIRGAVEDLNITNDHDCMVIKRKDIKCNKSWNNKICVFNKSSKTCEKNNCKEFLDKEYKISKIKARNIEKGDFVLIPFNTDVKKDNIITNKYEAMYAGYLASDGWVVNTKKTHSCTICMHQKEKQILDPILKYIYNKFDAKLKYKQEEYSKVVSARTANKKLFNYSSNLINGKGSNKKFKENVMFLDPELQKYVLGSYIQADGTWNKINQNIEITTYSSHLANQLLMMFYRCGILANGNKQKISKSAYKSDNTYRYIISVSSSESVKINDYVPGKCNNVKVKKNRSSNRFFWKNYVVSSVVKNKSYNYKGFVYDITVPEDYTVTANGVGIYQCRFYYCFTPENKVLMEDGTEKYIKNIKKNDFVINGEGGTSRVKDIHVRNISEDVLRIRVGGINNDIVTTKSHEIVSIKKDKKSDSNNQKLVNAKDIEKNDKLYFCKSGITKEFGYRQVASIKEEFYEGKVYDLELEDIHSYCVNRCVVHNSNEPKVAAGVDFYCFEPTMQVLMADGTQRAISSVKEGNAVRSHDGSINHIEKIHKREANEEMLRVNIAGINIGALKVTKGHEVLTEKNGKIKFDKIENLDKGDFLLSPCNYDNINKKYSKNNPYFIKNNYIYRKINSIKKYYYEGDVYDLTISNKSSYIVNRIAVHNSTFSMNGFTLECKDKKILNYYTELIKKLNLEERLNEISHEYFLIGDVFPFLEIECPKCGGREILPNGDICNHPDGTFKALKILNPDYIEVKDNPISNQAEYYLIPDEQLKMLIQRKEPKSLYEKLPQDLINLVNSGQPIRLSSRSVSHIKYNASHYGTYGTSMLQRLFTVLAYKTKIMTANWIIAERLIIPIRIVKVGTENRPANEGEIQDVANQLAAVANDPNLTVVTHHAVEYTWEGASGKIHNITQEIEQIGKEILDGLMINQSLLNGEMSCHDDETLTLTDNGFKKYMEIDENDKIACFNPENNKIEYHPYYEKLVYDYEGEMYHFQTDKIDIKVTPNHRMYTRRRGKDNFEIIEAENISKRSKFIGTIDGFDRERVENEDTIFSLDSKAKKYKNKEIQKENYKGKVYCFTVPYGLFVTMRNGKITIQGNSYNSAQVGVEVLIRRLENWRNKLKKYVERNIFLPVAMMQGFIDEDKSEELGDRQYIYPRFIWNELKLRDNTNKIQNLMQLNDKGLVANQTVLEELGLDYDAEVQKIRDEQVTQREYGIMPQGGGGSFMGGGMPLSGGGMGGDIGGLGGDLGGMGGGEMGGAMGGELSGMGGEAGEIPSGMGGMEGQASQSLPKITKKSKGKKPEEVKSPPPKMIKLTKLEQKLYKILGTLNIPFGLYAQYSFRVPGQKRDYAIDFAYPHIGVGIESDGNVWHQREDFKQRDLIRDQKLASVGWRILRFTEESINDNFDAVRDIIYKNIIEAIKDKKKNSKKSISDNSLMKMGSIKFNKNKIGINRESLENNMGEIILIGEINNE